MSRNFIRRGREDIVLQCRRGSVAQWIEQLRPKEKVVRSTRIWATRELFISKLSSLFPVVVEYGYG